MNIATLGDHLSRFKEAIYSIEGHCLDFQHAAELLQYAGGIKGINFSAASEAGMYCSGVAEFERQQEAAVTPFLSAHAVFTVSWMGLESLIDEIDPPEPFKIGKAGKIGRLCHFLKLGKEAVVIPSGYADIVSEWIHLEQRLGNDYQPRASLPNHTDQLGEGVYRVYSLRNHLFHGDFSGFDPMDDKWNAYTEALKLGTRIIAYTIQMALMISFKDSKFMETYWAHELFLDEDEVSISEGFSKLHLIE